MWRQDMTVQELIDLPRAEPMLFEPGERFDIATPDTFCSAR
jgi:hypothetical protein